MIAPPAVVVHRMADALAALAPGRPVTLLSAPGAALAGGCLWWAALTRQARVAYPATPGADVLDCADAPGAAMAALRAGVAALVLDRGCPAYAAVAAAAAAIGAHVLDARPPALDLAEPGAARRLAAWLGAGLPDTVTAPIGCARTTATAPRAHPERTMALPDRVREILGWYESDNPGTKANLVRLLMQGKLAGTGKMVILPVDQGFEHGPARSFAGNPPAYDPHYHYQLAIDAGLSAYASVLGMIEAAAGTYAGQMPTILKMNSSNSLATTKDQAVTASVKDALRLGCCAIGFTIYPGSEYAFAQMEEIRALAEEAKAAGLVVVIWSYPRGPGLDKDAETAFDICAYAAHMAALLGAHIIKVKPPTAHLSLPAAKKVYEEKKIDGSTMAARVKHVVQCCFAGRRLVVFSGGEASGSEQLMETIRGLAAGGASGSIIGRNSFTRPRDEALALLSDIVETFRAAP